LQRASGTFWMRGRLQAVAVTWTRTSGGKTPGCARPWCSGARLRFGPAAAPLAHDSIGGSDVPTDLLVTPVGMVVGGQDHAGAETGRLRRRMGAYQLPELLGLLRRQLNRICGLG